MKTTLTKYSIEDICKGFVYSQLEDKGLFGLSGRLTIQPEYQRNYIYAKENRDAAVVTSLLRGYPLGLIYFNKIHDDNLEVLDGQQRITSIGRFITNKFAIHDENNMPQYFDGLADDKKRLIMNSELLVYECEGEESEIKDWFKTINIAGVPLKPQELLNAVYSGPFVTAGKQEFSNSQNANNQKRSAYVSGAVERQDYWERALEWVSKSKSNIGDYMAEHRTEPNIDTVKAYFNTVIDWASSVFIDIEPEMSGLEWGRLYETYHTQAYDPKKLSEQVKALHGDPYIKNTRGIWEYLLGNSKDPNLLDVRVFDEATKKSTYAKQSKDAELNSVSNCPTCNVSKNANDSKIWKFVEMEADHVSAWSKGGATSPENCQMLCRTHNRAKGNK